MILSFRLKKGRQSKPFSKRESLLLYWKSDLGDRTKLICFPPSIHSELGPFDVQSTVELFSNTRLRHRVKYIHEAVFHVCISPTEGITSRWQASVLSEVGLQKFSGTYPPIQVRAWIGGIFNGWSIIKRSQGISSAPIQENKSSCFWGRFITVTFFVASPRAWGATQEGEGRQLPPWIDLATELT